MWTKALSTVLAQKCGTSFEEETRGTERVGGGKWNHVDPSFVFKDSEA